MTLVLASSLGTNGAMWDHVTPLLAPHVEPLTYDMRGHGAAPTPSGPYELADLAGDVLGLLDLRGIKRASFCGVSIGAMIGMWIAAHTPGRVGKLIVCCSSAHMPPAEAWRTRARTVIAARSTEPIADAVVQRWLTPEYATTHPEERAWLRSMLTGCDPDGYAACCGAIERMDLRPDLGHIRAPTLVIAAPRDQATPPAHGSAIAASIPGSRLELLTDGAHIAPVERAHDVAQLIIDHLRP